MSHEPHVFVPKEIPIERIFRKVMRRKMTALERISLHLKPVVKPHARKTA